MILFNKIEVSIINGNLSFQLITGVNNLVVDIKLLDSNGNHVLSSPYNQVTIPHTIALQGLPIGNYIINVTENGNSESFSLEVEGKGILPIYTLSPLGGIVSLIQGRTIQTEITDEYTLDYVYREIKDSQNKVIEPARRLNKNGCTTRASDGKCVHNSINRNLPNDTYIVSYYHFHEVDGEDVKHYSAPHNVKI